MNGLPALRAKALFLREIGWMRRKAVRLGRGAARGKKD